MTRSSEFSWGARRRSLVYAWRGVRTLLRSQHNAWLHAAASLGVVLLGVLLGVGRLEWLALVLAMFSVWTAEALNTALELSCDVASPDFHPLVEKAKDVAAAAVLISAVGALVVGGLVFGPHLWQALR